MFGLHIDCTFPTCNPTFAFLARSHDTIHGSAKNAKMCIPMHFWVPRYYSHIYFVTMSSAISFQFSTNKRYLNTLLIPENSDIQANQKLQSENPQSSLQIPCNHKDKERREIRVHRCNHLLEPPLRLLVPTVTSIPCRHNLISTPKSDLIKVTVTITGLFVLKLKPLNLIHMTSHDTYLVPNPFTPYPHLFTSTC